MRQAFKYILDLAEKKQLAFTSVSKLVRISKRRLGWETMLLTQVSSVKIGFSILSISVAGDTRKQAVAWTESI